MGKELLLTTLGGRVQCTQCNALSKRTRQRCQAPAIKGKTKCRFHGGRSTGAKTVEGRARIPVAHKGKEVVFLACTLP